MYRLKYKLMDEAGEGEGSAGTGEGSQSANQKVPEWQQAIPENIRGWDEVKNSDSPEKFWGQVENMRSFLGQSIRIPGEDAGAEQQQEFYDKLINKVPDLMIRPKDDDPDAMQTLYRQLGQPENSDDYRIPEIEAPEGIPVDENALKAFAPIAHKYGLSQKQFEGVLKDYNEGQLQGVLQQRSDYQQQMQDLRGEWGLTFDDNMQKADRVRQAFLGDDLASIEGLPPGIIRGLAKIADQFGGEGSNDLISSQGKAGVVAPSEAKAQVNEIMSNREHAYWNAGDPGHADAVKKVVALMKQANPDSSTEINDLRAGNALDM